MNYNLAIPKFLVKLVAELCSNGLPSFAYTRYFFNRCGLNIQATLPYLVKLLGIDWVNGFVGSLS